MITDLGQAYKKCGRSKYVGNTQPFPSLGRCKSANQLLTPN